MLAITVARRLCRKKKITSTTSTTASTSSSCTCCTEARMPVVRSLSTSTLQRAGSEACSSGSCFLMASTVPITLAPGWRCTLRMIAGQLAVARRRRLDCSAGPGAELRVLGAVDHARDVAHAHRRAVLPGDDQVLVVGRGHQLVVGVDGVGALRAVEAALGAVGVGRGDGACAACRAPMPDRGQRVGVGLDAHRRPLAARQRHQADAGDLADLLRQPRVDQVLHLGQRHACRS